MAVAALPPRCPPDLPALGVVEDVLEGLYGVRPLRVAMGATIPIGAAFRRILGIETVFFSFSTADEDFHGAERVLPARELPHRPGGLGARPGGARSHVTCRNGMLEV